MLKKIAAMLAAVAMVMGLAACNTVKGMGKDVEAAGEGVQNASDKARRGRARARPAPRPRCRGGAIARRDALCQRNGRHQQQGQGGRDGPVTQTGRNRKRHQACIQSVSREGSPRRVPWARQDVAFL